MSNTQSGDIREEAEERWFFSEEKIRDSPSRKSGINEEQELIYRRDAATEIQKLGHALKVKQVAINSAIVYMHRFYMCGSFTKFPYLKIAPAALFLATKAEDDVRTLKFVVQAHYYMHKQINLEKDSEIYDEKRNEVLQYENYLCQILIEDLNVFHPHFYVVKYYQLTEVPIEIAKGSYWMATNSLHMTTMCLRYKPNLIACVCISLVCEWRKYEIPRNEEGKDWFRLLDPSITLLRIESLKAEYLAVLEKHPKFLEDVKKSIINPEPSSSVPSSSSINSENKNIKCSAEKSTVQHSDATQITEKPQLSRTNNTEEGREMGEPGIIKSSSTLPSSKEPVEHRASEVTKSFGIHSSIRGSQLSKELIAIKDIKQEEFSKDEKSKITSENTEQEKVDQNGRIKVIKTGKSEPRHELLKNTALPCSKKFDDKHCRSTKNTEVGLNQITPKFPNPISQAGGSTHATIKTVSSSNKSENSLHGQQTTVLFNPTKLAAEPKNLNALNIQSRNWDSLSVVTTSAGLSIPHNISSSVLPSHKNQEIVHKEKKNEQSEKGKNSRKESKDNEKGKKHNNDKEITKKLPVSQIKSTPVEKESYGNAPNKSTISKSNIQVNVPICHLSPPMELPLPKRIKKDMPKELVTEQKKLDAQSIKLTHPENCNSHSVETTSAEPTTLLTNSTTVVSNIIKSHKIDHKEKKNEHTKKDKHLKRESKDEKKEKKDKNKNDKEKEINRNEKKNSENQPSKETSRTLETKGNSTPDVSVSNAKTLPASLIRYTEICTNSASNKVAQKKFIIPKSHAARSFLSTPRGIPPKEIPMPKIVKSDIPQKHRQQQKENQSHKRQQDISPDNTNPSKFQRISYPYHAPKLGVKLQSAHSTPLTLKENSFTNYSNNNNNYNNNYNKINTQSNNYLNNRKTYFSNSNHYNNTVDTQNKLVLPQSNFQQFNVEPYEMNVNATNPFYNYGNFTPMPPATTPTPPFNNENNYQYPQLQQQNFQYYNYSATVPNMNLPPPQPQDSFPTYNFPPPQPQDSYPTYNFPPPNFSHEHSQQNVTTAPPPYSNVNPPLPLGSPPKKPPTPPPE